MTVNSFFIRFLKEKGIYALYNEEMHNYYNSSQWLRDLFSSCQKMINHFLEYQPLNVFRETIFFAPTKKGQKFWISIDKQWKAELNLFYSPQTHKRQL